MTNTNLIFMDCETTGLDPSLDQVWSVAIVAFGLDGTRVDRNWFIHVTEGALERLDQIPPQFREIYDRTFKPEQAVTPLEFRDQFLSILEDLGVDRPYLVGAVPSFDDRRVGDLLGEKPWHYHLVCVENLIAGKLALTPPWNSTELSKKMGIDPDQFDRHTAYDDTLWALALYEAVMAS